MEGLSFLAAQRSGQRECCGVYDDTEGGERLITHQPPPLWLELGGGIDLIMLHALPFGSICDYLFGRWQAGTRTERWALQHYASRLCILLHLSDNTRRDRAMGRHLWHPRALLAARQTHSSPA